MVHIDAGDGLAADEKGLRLAGQSIEGGAKLGKALDLDALDPKPDRLVIGVVDDLAGLREAGNALRRSNAAPSGCRSLRPGDAVAVRS
jgi:hypothetical protein